jgi:hypothetical protein
MFQLSTLNDLSAVALATGVVDKTHSFIKSIKVIKIVLDSMLYETLK